MRSSQTPELFPVEDWLTLLAEDMYDVRGKGLLNRNDHFSAFGLYLDLCGVVWIEHPHSSRCFYPEGATYFTSKLPKEFCNLYGYAGSLYSRKLRFFYQICELPSRAQARQLRLLCELDERDKVRKHERKLCRVQAGD